MSSDSSEDLVMDPVAVQNIQDGLRSAIGEFREFTMETSAAAGSGLHKLTLTGLEAGHPSVAAALEEFCDRWDAGVSSLVIRTSGLAHQLGIAAGSLWEEDQYRKGAFKVLANAGIGNPYASEDEVERKSLDAIFADHMFTRETPEQARQTREEFDRTWAATKQGLMNEGIGGDFLERAADATGMDRAALDQVRGGQAPGEPAPDRQGSDQLGSDQGGSF
ncbi:hypothetical protein [Streptomyces bambusae]|uniref:Uncharacterized protein n=1 Tax=Streptomyces bambusae TaxID=1550616 RepID=A0ABS6YZV8_9ACTN|nr:hypothetical protein [Streptomyces bambusae]MBW5480871.1 hypothetical protein [Streptomyces bambusae]